MKTNQQPEDHHQEAHQAAATLLAYLTDQESELREQISDLRTEAEARTRQPGYDYGDNDDTYRTVRELETQAAYVTQARKRAERIQDDMQKAGLPH